MVDRCCICGKVGQPYRFPRKDGECRLYFDSVVTAEKIREKKTKLGGEIEETQRIRFSGYFCHKHKKQFAKFAEDIIMKRVHQNMGMIAEDLRKEGVDTPQLKNLEDYLDGRRVHKQRNRDVRNGKKDKQIVRKNNRGGCGRKKQESNFCEN